jgi:hypothetical protein
VLADEAGFEGVVPLARWKGFVEADPEHISHRVLDPLILAAGVATVTQLIGVFSTVQVASMLPNTRSGKIKRRLLRDVAEGRELRDTSTLLDPSVFEAIRVSK